MEEAMDTEPRTWHNAYFTRVREDGLEEGLQRGLERGLEVGELRYARRTLEVLLERVGIPVSSKVRERIHACDDLGQLEAWTAKVVDARDCRELFEDP
jgi:hypothetical protein